ncbi:membrane protein [Thioclava dalianensis]|uniref:Membrane protein n=1 Tax=Thioclava dalianensis TaxID=1185766 RepID=A0A074U8P8_9RHOB|nr:OmpW family outer membrane protein [Thioclava dalianensis]KEP71057.1 membrane protein [Thioclava dalianensis]SFN25862.1 outer membrane protein [Thioclava dalianensis]
MKQSILSLTLLAATTLSAAPALAQQAGDITLGVGVHQVMPRSDNGTLSGGLSVDIGNSTRPTFTAEYFVRDNLGIELLAALPFKHSVNIDGLGQVGTVKHLPPVISLQYHFPTGTNLTPFVGAGVNYTAFFSEKTSGALAGNNLSLKNSWGLALHAGLDYTVSEHGSLRTDIRWIDINSDVKLNGTKIGKVKIDPVVVGVAYIYKF